MPAVSQKQRAFLNWKKGHAWVKAHHFDNKGKLPDTHHEDEEEKKEESMTTAKDRVMRMVLRFEKAHGKTLSEEEERFLAEDISTVDIGPGPATTIGKPKTDPAFRRFIAKRKEADNRRKKVPNPTHDMQA